MPKMHPSIRQLVLLAVVVLAAFALYQQFGGSNEGGRGPPLNDQQSGRRVVAFGDRLAASLGNRIGNLDVTNLGNSGPETSMTAAARIGEAVAQNPNFVVVAVGSDDLDLRTPLEDTLAALEAIFTRAQAAGALVAYLPATPPLGTGDNWLMAIRDLCRRKRVAWIEPLPAGPEGTPAKTVSEHVGLALAPYL